MIWPSLYPLNTHEAAHVHGVTVRWLERFVIGKQLCPFAKAVHTKNQIAYVLTAAQHEPDVEEEVNALLARFKHTEPAMVDTVLLVCPNAFSDFLDFSLYLPRVNALLKSQGLKGELQWAHFHPGYVFAGEYKDDASHFTNRSPYPVFHLLRESSIERAVQAFPDPAAIFENNIDHLRQEGYAALMAQWEACFKPTGH